MFLAIVAFVLVGGLTSHWMLAGILALLILIFGK